MRHVIRVYTSFDEVIISDFSDLQSSKIQIVHSIAQNVVKHAVTEGQRKKVRQFPVSQLLSLYSYLLIIILFMSSCRLVKLIKQLSAIGYFTLQILFKFPFCDHMLNLYIGLHKTIRVSFSCLCYNNI